jgi:glycosyltransferase involved in cell wall biosynthesis
MMRRRRLLEWTGRFRDRAYDVVHVQTPFVAHYAGLTLGRRLGLAVVESYHTYFEHYLHHYVPGLPSAATRWLARRATVSQCAAVQAVVAPSRQMAEALGAYGVRTPIEVLPTGLPPEAFERGERARFRSRHGIPDDRPVALYVGRVAHEKNIDFLVRMLARLRASVPDVLLVIAGEGPAERHLRELVARLGLERSVLFLGYMDRRSELPDCYSGADAFVFASRTETQGLVLLEALAQGTPVISTAIMGTIDVLHGAGGAVIVDEQEDAFAAAVAAVLRDPGRRATLAASAVADAARWSSRALAQRLVSLYEALHAARPAIGAAPASALAGEAHQGPGIRKAAG